LFLLSIKKTPLNSIYGSEIHLITLCGVHIIEIGDRVYTILEVHYIAKLEIKSDAQLD
jgi:hypothetical protein